MADLSSLDFRLGLEFQALPSSRFGLSSQISSPDPSLDFFFLVASFSRFAHRLDTDVVALILQSILGGNALNFCVVHLADRSFRFSVVSKLIGLMVHRLSKFVCKGIAVFFTLWRDGGPDYLKEKAKWDQEMEVEW